MNTKFTGVPPTHEEVERIRLLLSTYQDGTGQLVLKNRTGTFPNWRDFERSAAIALKGVAQESKSVFDVIVSPSGASSLATGVSCKMRSELKQVYSRQIILVEVSNASGDFKKALKQYGINSTEEMSYQAEYAGKAILDLVESWHNVKKSIIDLNKSYYLVLQYETTNLMYQLFQLPLKLPDPSTLSWRVRFSKLAGKETTGSLIGQKEGCTVIEWYADSGGQLKYFAKLEDAVWRSNLFRLEPLPGNEEGYGVLQKAKVYFPDKWNAVKL